MNDEDIRETLEDIVADTVVSDWESDFIENIVFDYDGPLSEAQRDKALEIISKYG